MVADLGNLSGRFFCFLVRIVHPVTNETLIKGKSIREQKDAIFQMTCFLWQVRNSLIKKGRQDENRESKNRQPFV